MSGPWRHALRGVIAAVALVGASALASDPASSAAAVASAAGPETIEPVPVAEIAQRAEDDEQFAQDVILRAEGPDPTQALSDALDTLEAGVRDLAARYKVDQLGEMRETSLDTLMRYWRLRREQLADWRNSVRGVGQRRSDDVADIARRRATWEATRAAATASGLSAAMVARANAVLEQIHLAERALAGPLDAELRLSRRGNALQARIDSALRDIAAAQANIVRRLTELDAPPLLAMMGQPREAGRGLAVLKQRRDIERQFFLEYVEFHKVRLRLQAAIAVVILWLLLAARHRDRAEADEARRARPDAPILDRPLSAWLLIVVVGVAYFEPDAPATVRAALSLLALVPVLRLLPAAEYAVVKRWPYFAAALYVLYEMNVLLLGAPLLDRLHLILVGGLAMMALWYLLAELRSSAKIRRPTAYSTLIQGICRLFMAALLVGLVANVAGNVSLATALTGGVINSGYSALVIYAAAGVLRALVFRRTTSPEAAHTTERYERRESFAHGLTRLLRAIAFATWVVLTLAAFRVLRPVVDAVRSVLDHPIVIGSFKLTPGSVLLFVACVLASYWIAKGVRFLLRDEVLPQVTLPRGAANSISTLTYYAVVLCGLLVAFLAAGLEPSRIAIVLGALGVGIGFGLQNFVNNVLSGLVLMFERPIQPGDTILFGTVEGKVGEITMRTTRVRTFDGADVFVPNGALLSGNLTNWTLNDFNRRFEVNVGVAYGSDMPTVFAALMQAARATPGVSQTPDPMVMFTGFGASSLDFMLRVWTTDNDHWIAIRSTLAVAVNDALLAAGVEIPFPQRDLHLRSVSPQARADLSTNNPPPAGNG